jgi:hypothetical protein
VFPLDAATVERIAAPLTEPLETEKRTLETKLGRVRKGMGVMQNQTYTGQSSENGYARQGLFAEDLRQRFRDDQVDEIRRGGPGADVHQVVRNGSLTYGSILWEVKRAAKWNAGWLRKLTTDRNAAGATIGVIVAADIPEDIGPFGQAGDVFVCGFDHALNFADMLRVVVAAMWKREAAAAGQQDGQPERLFGYVFGGGFGRHYQTIGQTAMALLQDLEKDQRALQRRWKQTGMLIHRLVEVYDQIPLDLIEILGAGSDLPAVFQGDMPAAADALPTVDGEVLMIDPPQLYEE